MRILCFVVYQLQISDTFRERSESIPDTWYTKRDVAQKRQTYQAKYKQKCPWANLTLIIYKKKKIATNYAN